MSWQLSAFATLALSLGAGFMWYERTRPDARVVALVATLAAFAALGRIAFAALPNVKPTTDIVLVSGYALGGAPGFVVGAIAGLTSNFFFGQGPWTPWQMAAWGVTGLLGAGLASVTGRRLGRWPLAVFCAAVGFAFTVVQDLGDWVTYSDHSLAQLGVYVGKGLGFDAIHAGGCFLFALAFGPALARSISRFAARLHVEWRAPRGAVAGVIAALILGGWLASQPGAGGGLGGSRGAGPGEALAATTPTGYLLGVQNTEGGYGPAPGASSSQLFSGWAALGLEAEGYNPQDVRQGGQSLMGYIGGGSLGDVGSLERTILVVSAAGLRASSFHGEDLVAALEGHVRGDGSVSDQVNLTAFAVLALRAAGVGPPAGMVAWLIHQQDGDGGFNFATAGGSSDVDDTGAALEALAGAGDPGASRARGRAIGFMFSQQNSDGGFPANPGGESNAQSTAWAVQGLLAAGADGPQVGQALGYLSSLIASDGHVQYSRSSDQTPVWVTAQAVMALARKPLPLAPAAGQGGGGAARRTARRGGAASAGSGGAGAAGASAARRRINAAEMAALNRLLADEAVVTALALAPIDAN